MTIHIEHYGKTYSATTPLSGRPERPLDEITTPEAVAIFVRLLEAAEFGGVRDYVRNLENEGIETEDDA